MKNKQLLFTRTGLQDEEKFLSLQTLLVGKKIKSIYFDELGGLVKALFIEFEGSPIIISIAGTEEGYEGGIDCLDIYRKIKNKPSNVVWWQYTKRFKIFAQEKEMEI